MNSETENTNTNNGPLKNILTERTAGELNSFAQTFQMFQELPATPETQATLAGETVLKVLEDTNRRAIENILKAGDNSELTALLIAHFITLSISYIGQTIRLNEAPELIELLKESNEDTTPEERRKEIEDVITGNEKNNVLMYVGLLDQLNSKEKAAIEKQITENETFKKIAGGAGPNLNIDLCALNAADLDNIDILEEYENRLNECINDFTIRRAGGSFFYVPRKREYMTAGKLEQIRGESGLQVATVPDVLPEPTLPGYTRAIKPWQNMTGRTENKAGLAQKLHDLVVTDTGKILNPKGRDVTRQYLEMVKRGDIQTEIKDPALVQTAFAIAQRIHEETGTVPDVITVKEEELTKALYHKDERHSRALEIAKRIIDESQTIGLLPTGAIAALPYITFQGYWAETKTIAFSVPYAKELLKHMDADKEQIEAVNKEYNQTHRNRYKRPEEIPAFHYLIKSTLNQARNQPAAAIVREIVQVIERSGYREIEQHGRHWTGYKINRDNRNQPAPIIPHISVSELIKRVPELERALENSKNQSAEIKRIFTYTWLYMNEHTKITEKYQAIILPGHNMPGVNEMNNEQRALWIPKKKTLKTLVFEFRLLPKDEQLNRLENLLY